jgi:methyl-accepting chemotaxis protein
MKIANLKIGRRLGLAFFLVLVFLCSIAALGINRLSSLNQSMSLLVNDRFPKVMLGGMTLYRVKDVSISLRNILLMDDAGLINAELDRIKHTSAAMTADHAAFRGRISTAEGHAIFAAVDKLKRQFDADQAAFLALVGAGKPSEAKAYLLTTMAPHQEAYLAQIQGQVQANGTLMEQSREAAEQNYMHSRNATVGLAGLSLLLASALALRISRGITRPLGRAVSIAGTIAGGDLSSVINVDGNDETGQLLRSLQAMNGSLAHIVGEVRRGSNAISTAAREIASGTLDLSARTEQQAGTLEETASSMEQLTSAVQQNASNAQQASRIAKSAALVARQGGEEVAQVVERMSTISASSNRISDIVGVIDSIAFQTNILALNASVEAARAGEQGRGFAVVASEVRSLAHRSALAAKEIKVLIDDSAEKVSAGSQFAIRAGTTMAAIVAEIERVAALMADIETASREQAVGIDQVNTAIAGMDQVTQQNAALVEQAAATSESMLERTHALSTAVSIFVLNEERHVEQANHVQTSARPARTAARSNPGWLADGPPRSANVAYVTSLTVCVSSAEKCPNAFLPPRLIRPSAVALHFARCGQFTAGLSPEWGRPEANRLRVILREYFGKLKALKG